jgi:hypothetical protein
MPPTKQPMLPAPATPIGRFEFILRSLAAFGELDALHR